MERWRMPRNRFLLSAMLSLLAVPGAFAAEPECVMLRVGFIDRPTTSQVLLSLHLARVKKDERKVSLYKSVARQRRAKERPTSGVRIPSRGNSRVTSGRFPSSGR